MAQDKQPYTEVTKTGYGSRIISSLKGILIGFLLFIVSFGVLWWNEGRTDLSKVAKDATPIEAHTLSTNANLEGELVSTMGTLRSPEEISDGQFLAPGNYLSLSRQVEMYAWTEVAESETTTNLGGSQTTETTYTYTQEWTSMPADSSNFKVPEGHENPSLSYERVSKTANNGTMGAYSVSIKDLQLTGSEQLTLSPSNTTLPDGAEVRDGKYVYIPAPQPEEEETLEDILFGEEDEQTTVATTPAIGDVRISYTVVPSPQEDVTLIGKLNGNKISPYYTKDGDKVYRIFQGDADSAVATLSGEHKFSTWMWRLVGFLLMWFGLTTILGPISVLLDVLPFLGKVSRATISLASFIVALVLSIVTILISMILHNIWLVLILVLAVLGGGYWWLTKKKGIVLPWFQKDGADKAAKTQESQEMKEETPSSEEQE